MFNWLLPVDAARYITTTCNLVLHWLAEIIEQHKISSTAG